MKQYFLNLLLWGDLTLSTLLGGYPRDTVSLRLYRARAAGSKSACRACRVLTWIVTNVVRIPRDHCTHAASNEPSIGAEVWHWGVRR